MSALRYFRPELEAAVDTSLQRPRTNHVRLDMVELTI
jgi:hypothetical protein